MVSPVNSPGATASCQKSMYQCGLLQQLCTILMATGVPADILTEVIAVLQPQLSAVKAHVRLSDLTQPLFSDHQHCIGGYQRLTGQPGLLCFCQRSLKSAAVRQDETPPEALNLRYPSEAAIFCVCVGRPSWCCSCPWWTRGNRLSFAVRSSTVSSVSSTRTRKARERL